MRFVAAQTGTLQLDVEAVREQSGETLRDRTRSRHVAGDKCLADRALLGAREHDQPCAELREPVPPDPGLAALHVAQPAARQQLAQVQVTLLALRQQQ